MPLEANTYKIIYWHPGEVSTYVKELPPTTSNLQANKVALDYGDAGWCVELWATPPAGRSLCIFEHDPQGEPIP